MKYKCVGGPMDGKEIETQDKCVYIEALASPSVHVYSLCQSEFVIVMQWNGLAPKYIVPDGVVVRRHPHYEV